MIAFQEEGKHALSNTHTFKFCNINSLGQLTNFNMI